MLYLHVLDDTAYEKSKSTHLVNQDKQSKLTFNCHWLDYTQSLGAVTDFILELTWVNLCKYTICPSFSVIHRSMDQWDCWED